MKKSKKKIKQNRYEKIKTKKLSLKKATYRKKENQNLKIINKIKNEVSKVVVGQEKIVDGLIRAIISKGHVLVEGVPGTAKTLIVKAIAIAIGCDFGRVQFTVDLLPTDIVGITTLSPNKKTFQVLKGPIFNNFLLADEINRSPPKTQGALLEAMQEKHVTIGKNTYKLDQPFFVIATQNPIESSGTYPLPEAQIDRFIFKLVIDYPAKEHEELIIRQNIDVKPFEDYNLKKVITPKDILKMQKAVHEIEQTDRINKYIVELVNATRTPKAYNINLGKYIQLGCSPRASINLSIAAKADALVNNQKFVAPQNIKNIAKDVLRHRLKLNYKANIENVKSEDVIDEILSKVKIP